MPRPRFHRLEPERRRAVLDTAAAEFAAHGYHEASVNRVQAALGLSKGAFYYWFDDKEDLFVTTLEDALATAFQSLPGGLEVPEEGDFWAWAEAQMRTMLVWAMAHPTTLALGKASLALPPEGRLGALWQRGRELTADLILRAQQGGHVREDLPPDLLASVIFGMGEAMDRWTFHRLEVEGDLDVDAVMATYVDLLRRVSAP